MVLLPSLIFLAQVKGSRVLKVGRQNDSLVASLTGQLDTQVPGIECDKDKVEVLRGKVFGSKGIEAVNGIAEASGVSNMLPGECGKARWRGRKKRLASVLSGSRNGGSCLCDKRKDQVGRGGSKRKHESTALALKTQVTKTGLSFALLPMLSKTAVFSVPSLHFALDTLQAAIFLFSAEIGRIGTHCRAA